MRLVVRQTIVKTGARFRVDVEVDERLCTDCFYGAMSVERAEGKEWKPLYHVGGGGFSRVEQNEFNDLGLATGGGEEDLRMPPLGFGAYRLRVDVSPTAQGALEGATLEFVVR